MLQLGRVGSYPDLNKSTVAKYASPLFSPNNCTVDQLLGFTTGNAYDPAVCPRQSYLDYEEQKTVVSLWSIARSPLIMGGDLTATPSRIIALLTNKHILTINSFSRNASQILRTEDGKCV